MAQKPQDSEIIKMVLRKQNTLRLVKLIPTWENFADTEDHFILTRTQERGLMKLVEAYWRAMFEIMQDAEDYHAVAYLVAYRVKLAARRSYAKEVMLDLKMFGNMTEEKARTIEAAAEKYFEGL